MIMNEDLKLEPLREQIQSINPVVGLGEAYQDKLDLLIEQLSKLHCFDGDPEYAAEFKEVILGEIKKGAARIGFFGSRANGSQIPYKSDLDVIVISPKVNDLFPKKGLASVDLAGKINYWGSKTIGIVPAPRIHINRYSRLDKKCVPAQILRSAVWVWTKEVSNY